MDDIVVYETGYNKVIVKEHKNTFWEPSKKIREEIEKRWAERISPSCSLWNDTLVRLDNLKREGDTLYLSTSNTDYKYYFGTSKKVSLSNRANPIYVSANLITKDNYLVFGIKHDLSCCRPGYNISAGSLHPVLDAANGVPSLEIGLDREIFEEFGLVPESFRSLTPKMFYGLKTRPTGTFLYEIELKLDSQQVRNKFEALLKKNKEHGSYLEFDDISFLPFDKQAIRDEVISNGKRYRPMVSAMLKYISR